MYLGSQIEAPEGLGCLNCKERYYYAGRTDSSKVLLIWFYRSKGTRWRVGYIHLPFELFERELNRSPRGLLVCKDQFNLPPAIRGLEGLNFNELGHIRNSETNHQQHVQFRLDAIHELLTNEQKILNAINPLKCIAQIGKQLVKKLHPWDLQYWFFSYLMHGRNRWALKSASHLNGTWARNSAKHINSKFGRPSAGGVRKGWPVAPMSETVIQCYLRHCALGVSMAEIYRRSIIDDFGCRIYRDTNGRRHIVHPMNSPFPSYGQFRYVVVNQFGLSNVETSKFGASRMSRSAKVDLGNTTGTLANIMDRVEIDAYRCAERPSSRTGGVMPELVVARAICATTGARVGIGFSLGGESQNAYRAMLGGDVDAAVGGDRLLAGFGPARLVGDVLLEGIEGLSTKSNAIHEKKNALHMSSAHECIDEGDAGSGFAGSGCHDKQE